MEIRRLSLLEGSLNAAGVSVVIDVFRAFTCEPLLFHYGVKSITLEYDIEKCLAKEGDYIRIGENNEVPIEGFDLTNSPFLIMEQRTRFFSSRDIIHRTTSGVRGAINALDNSDTVLLASFVNAKATADLIKKIDPELVSIVAMGIRSVIKAPEDEFCGDYIQSLLTGERYDHVRATHEILAHETAQKFLRGDKQYLPKEDPAICLQRDLFDFAIRAEKSMEGSVLAVKVSL